VTQTYCYLSLKLCQAGLMGQTFFWRWTNIP